MKLGLGTILQRILIASIAIALLSSVAWSNTVRLKRGLVVEPEKRLVLSDIADLDGAYASGLGNTPIAARASELLGASGTGEIGLDEVRAVLKRSGAVLGRLEFSGSVCRLRSNALPRRSEENPREREATDDGWRTLEHWQNSTGQTVEIAIVRRFMADLDVSPDRLRLRFERGSEGLINRSSTELRTVVRATSAIANGAVLFRVEQYEANGSLALRESVRVEAQVLRAVLKLREQVSRRGVIGGGMLEPSEEWLSAAVDAVDASEAMDMVGKIAQTRLLPGNVLLRSQIEEPIAIERNALVEMVYHGDGFVLKAQGRARQAGRVGDLIEVRVEDSRSSVLARVDGPGRVIVVQ